MSVGISGAVTFTGALPDVRVALKMFDVFVLPSLSETFSNAALEAMAMQVPVILTRTGGAAEMIEHGKRRLHRRRRGIAERLPELLNQLRLDTVLRTRMAAAAGLRAQAVISRGTACSPLIRSMLGAREAVSHA